LLSSVSFLKHILKSGFRQFHCRREESKKQAAAAEAATAAVVKSKCTIAGEVIRQWRSSRRHGSQGILHPVSLFLSNECAFEVINLYFMM
jgi:hypothetical protein